MSETTTDTTVVTVVAAKEAKPKKEVVAPIVLAYSELGEVCDSYISLHKRATHKLNANSLEINLSESVPKVNSEFKRIQRPLLKYEVRFNDVDGVIEYKVLRIGVRAETLMADLKAVEKKDYSSKAKDILELIYLDAIEKTEKYINSRDAVTVAEFDLLETKDIVGAYTGIQERAYHMLRGESNSLMSHVEETFNHYEHNKKNPPTQTEAMKLGSLAHLKVLEPARYKRETIVLENDKRTTLGKIKDMIYRITLADRVILTPDQESRVLAMEINFREHPVLMALYEESRFEVTYFWMELDTLCRGRVDGEIKQPSEKLAEFLSKFLPYSKEVILGSVIIWDYKSTDGAGDEDFSRTIDQRDYHVQGAGYTLAGREIYKKPVIYLFACAEKVAPYQVDVKALCPMEIEEGIKTFHNRINKIKYHRENPKAWKGYPLVKTGFITRPVYAQNRDMMRADKEYSNEGSEKSDAA